MGVVLSGCGDDAKGGLDAATGDSDPLSDAGDGEATGPDAAALDAALADAGLADASISDASTEQDAALSDAAPPPDGGGTGDRFACAGEPLPDTADDPIVVTGIVEEITSDGSVEPHEGASLEARELETGDLLDQDTSGADGSYALEAATGGDPLEAVLDATHPEEDIVPTHVFPPTPLTEDVEGQTISIVSQATLDLVYQFVVLIERDETKATLIAAVLDCNGDPVEGAEVAIDANAEADAYSDDEGVPDTNATSTNDDGLAYFFNVDVGGVQVSAERDDLAFRAHTVETFADEMTQTALVP